MTEPELLVYEKNTCTTCRNLFYVTARQGNRLRVRRVPRDRADRKGDKAASRQTLGYSSGHPSHAQTPRQGARLDDPERVSDEDLIAHKVEHPELVQRPMVIRGDRGVLARPVERVLELFD